LIEETIATSLRALRFPQKLDEEIKQMLNGEASVIRPETSLLMGVLILCVRLTLMAHMLVVIRPGCKSVCWNLKVVEGRDYDTRIKVFAVSKGESYARANLPVLTMKWTELNAWGKVNDCITSL
jgi:hypothetical protein